MWFRSEHLTNPLHHPGRYLGRSGRQPQSPMSARERWLGQNRLVRDLDRPARFLAVDGDLRVGGWAQRELAAPGDGLEQPAMLRPDGDRDSRCHPESTDKSALRKESPERDDPLG